MSDCTYAISLCPYVAIPNEPISTKYVTIDYPKTWIKGEEPYYPMNDEKNNRLFDKYKELAKNEKNVIFGGRLGEYKYYDII